MVKIYPIYPKRKYVRLTSGILETNRNDQLSKKSDRKDSKFTAEKLLPLRTWIEGERKAARFERTYYIRKYGKPSKLGEFYEEGMREHMARWEDVMNKNGDYVEH
ncbi:hypothetical protein ACTXT7_003299 [Hymenolepis weldensis]